MLFGFSVMRMRNVGAIFAVSGALVAAYLGWTAHRIGFGILVSDANWPREWPYPDRWVFAYERWLDSERPAASGEHKMIGESRAVEARACFAAVAVAALAVVGSCLWAIGCWNSTVKFRLTGQAADYADGLAPGPDCRPRSRLVRAWDHFAAATSMARRSFLRAGLPAGLVAVLGLAGLSAWPARTADPGPPVRLRAIHCEHLKLPIRGWVLWAKEGEIIVQVLGLDGTAIRQLQSGQPLEVPLPFSEWRYRLSLSPEQWQEIERLVGAHDFWRLNDRLRPRYGANESTLIRAVPTGGPAVEVAVWTPSDHRDFEQIYNYLQSLLPGPNEAQLVYEGPHDQHWKPEGFGAPR